MLHRVLCLAAAAALPLALPGVAPAAVYDEAVEGDLADLASGPTFFSVEPGVNTVIGTVGGSSSADFEDFVGFVVPEGQQLDAVTLTSFVTAGGNTSTGFRLYTDQGAGFFQASTGSITTASIEVNYLTVWDLSDVGGSAPLGEGTYGVLLAEFTPGQAYSFDIVTSIIPEPASLGVLGLAGIALRRRR